ncbi:hypothetical protein BJ508DRAFT_335829 [Ascobolus immersus RN42]|uniref:Fungal N-terminal domain-containing protein n=1 Tax=Ascobolus immersus RN42 TaxID=1160509 RepID=A0A3N4HI02_ASCIM|nr:hypothetical protein BJ508DRAFT_335829 [Ascobolus immersus RN42]
MSTGSVPAVFAAFSDKLKGLIDQLGTIQSQYTVSIEALRHVTTVLASVQGHVADPQNRVADHEWENQQGNIDAFLAKIRTELLNEKHVAQFNKAFDAAVVVNDAANGKVSMCSMIAEHAIMMIPNVAVANKVRSLQAYKELKKSTVVSAIK